ncbi:WD40 repeat-like protein [Cutaneotrichosporon oleaginosum]|uniref:WD40 repeat-like protein n=1 Tax=Cutaneotrichosporon oleaginosum TaxID=879819 RepID=A0A0J0XQC3_9TREE|nr:WD40 repeat-like protein [Cutaneotrichosporon oleaginosum]KLT43277.1 WD40 repeat-like protein [Cutaneotrichosporon oleaginosum]TXT14460.1 hypothetical protein COLE_00653 [Cutaneotrichosporon oleaginosum]
MEANPNAVHSAPTHLEGLTRVCFSPDGKTIYTAGADCLVRLHDAADPDAEPGFHDEHKEAVTSITASAELLVTACLDAVARAFRGKELDGYIMRASGVPLRWVQVDAKGSRVAVCSDENLVYIVDVNDRDNWQKIPTNDAPARSAAWDPTGQYLVLAGCDGKLRVYDTSEKSPFNKRNLEGMIKTSQTDAQTQVYVAWHPSGDCFAVPTRTHEIALIARDTWSKLGSFHADGHSEVVGELAWSPNGKYLASAAGKELLIWATEGKHVVTRCNAEAAVTGLAWAPNANLIAFTTENGWFNRWSEPVGPEFASPFLSDADLAKKADKLLDDDLFGDDAVVDFDEVGEELGDDLGDDWLVDDDGAFAEDDAEVTRGGRTQVVSVTKAQPPFVPGATEWRATKRYLAFNMIGVVDATDQETHNVVNVEFHDKSARRGYHFSDHVKYTMASLGEQGIAYAAPAGDNNALSVVHYRPYDSWASSADWSVNLLAGEDALSVAMGGPESGLGTVVVATSKGFVRFFTASGVQRYVWRLGEEVVTLAAGRDALLVVHREGGTSLDGCQNLRYSLLDLETFDAVQEGRIPLPRNVTLAWAGFSAAGVPVIYDSAGVLSALDRFRRPNQGRWVPLFDGEVARGGKRETYWPVGVSEEPGVLHAIILKGAESAPFFPRPLLQDLDLQMPLLATDTAVGALEEKIARASILLSAEGSDDREVQIDQHLLKLVQSACKADSLARALDVARLMHTSSSLDAARSIADYYRFPGLVERIRRVKTEKGRERVSWIDAEPQQEYVTRARAGRVPVKEFEDFAPARKRSFAGREQPNRASRAETPAASRRTVIPETPGPEEEHEESMEPFDSTAGKTFDESIPFVESPKRKRSDDEPEPLKARSNPFAKRAGGNPFAKAAVARPLDSIKSTSFFDRVDDIEAKGPQPPKRSKMGKGTKPEERGPKQTTLFGMRKPAQVAKDSYATEATEEEDPEASDQLGERAVQDSMDEFEETLMD